MAKIEVQILGDSSSLERSFARAAASSTKFRVSIGSLIRTTAALTGTVLGVQTLSRALVGSVQASASFQTSMQRIVGLAGGSQKSIKGLSDQLLELGPRIGKSPQELADALYFVASAGIAVDKQLSVVVSSAKASAAGLGDTQTVADAVTSAMNSYGQSALSAAKATDVLTATVREGKGEAAQFAPVIGLVAPIAAQLGVSFDQVGAALASMTRLGTPAETAAIQLGQALNELLKVTPAAAKAFRSVGLNAGNLREELGKKNGLLLVLEQIRAAFTGNDVALAKAFPNIRALRGVLALVGKQSDQVRGVFDRLADSTGSLGIAFGAVSETTQQKFNRTAAALQAAEIRIGAALAPIAEKFSEDVGKIASGISKWLSNTENQARVEKTLNSVMRDAGQIIGAVKDIIVSLTPAVKAVTSAVGGLANAVKLLVAALVITKVTGFATSLGLVGTQAEGATGKIAALRGGLLGLSRMSIAPILIPLALSFPDQGKSGGGKPGTLTTLDDTKGLERLARQGKLSLQTIINLEKSGSISVAAAKRLILAIPRSPSGQVHPSQRAAVNTATQQQSAQEKKSTNDIVKTTRAATDGLKTIFARFDLALSRAQLTPGLKDDLKVLNQELATVQALLAKHKNNLDLQQREVDIKGQILAIQKQQVQTLKDQREAQKQALEDARNTAKSLFGSLFQAPDLTQPSATLLGGTQGRRTVPGTGGTARDLLANITRQNQAFATLERDIATLVRKGAPASLVQAARSGQISSEQIDALAHASSKTLERIFSQVRRADKLITQAAKAEIRVKTASITAGTVVIPAGAGRRAASTGTTIVIENLHTNARNAKDLERDLERLKKQRAGQRRGRTGGKR